MNTITISPEAYQQAEAYAQEHSQSVSEVIENALAKLFKTGQRKRTTTKTDNPSPSGDPWFDDPENMAIVLRGLEQARRGQTREITREERYRKFSLM